LKSHHLLLSNTLKELIKHVHNSGYLGFHVREQTQQFYECDFKFHIPFRLIQERYIDNGSLGGGDGNV